MALKRGFCTHCQGDEIQRIFNVNREAEICYCPVCAHPMQPKDAIVNYRNLISNYLKRASRYLFETTEYNRRAFCYLVVPPLASITDDARRRLKAIEQFSDLGSGFNIAMQDLDIRGAGNLLGAEQSGYIADMGYETYQKILSEAMEELGVETGLSSKNVKNSYVEDCTIETDQPAYIPDTYIEITAEKIRIYKEMDSIVRDKELTLMANRIVDRFGPMPPELENLFDVVRIRQMGEKLGFDKIIIKNGILIAFFISNPMSAYYRSPLFGKVMEKIQASGSTFELKQNDGRLRVISRDINSTSQALQTLKRLL